MRIFEPHAHMYARTTADYEAMARAGVEYLVEPAFWLGETRKHAGSFFDYFDHLINYEHSRAGRYGIQQYVTIAMNPKESNNFDLAQEVLEELPRFLERPQVVAVGEIGFDAINTTEEEFFVRQAELAREFKLPILIHSPHLGKFEGIKRLIDVLKGMDYNMDQVLMDHNVEDTTPMSLKAGCWAGHRLRDPAVARRMAHPGDNVLADSDQRGGGLGSSDHFVGATRDHGAPPGATRRTSKLVWDNPWNFSVNRDAK
jgi:predicted metal-dependent TIM-barrel fold hydrolase